MLRTNGEHGRLMMRIMLLLLSLWFLLSATSVAAQQAPLRIAVAANFTQTANVLLEQFSEKTGIITEKSSASSGALYAQILHGAPYDVFLSADKARPEALEKNQLIVPNSRRTYVVGELVLIAKSPITDLTSPEQWQTWFKRHTPLAIANPKTAPYGQAAEDVFQHLAIWPMPRKSVIVGNNVIQALQFYQTGNVEFALIARHMVNDEPHVVAVPQPFYSPIEQQLVILARTEQLDNSQQFVEFLRSNDVRKQLSNLGYKVP